MCDKYRENLCQGMKCVLFGMLMRWWYILNQNPTKDYEKWRRLCQIIFFFLPKSHVDGDIENIVWTLNYMKFWDISITLVGSDGKESACNAGDLGSIPGSVRSPGEGNGYPLWYSCLENSWTDEPGRLQFIGLQRVRHDWATNTHKQVLRG